MSATMQDTVNDRDGAAHIDQCVEDALRRFDRGDRSAIDRFIDDSNSYPGTVVPAVFVDLARQILFDGFDRGRGPFEEAMRGI